MSLPHAAAVDQLSTRDSGTPAARRRTFDWLFPLSIVCVAACFVRAIAFTPLEALQGPAQKILYVHPMPIVLKPSAPSMPHEMQVTFFSAFGSFTLFFIALLRARYRLAVARQTLARRQLERSA